MEQEPFTTIINVQNVKVLVFYSHYGLGILEQILIYMHYIAKYVNIYQQLKVV